MRRGEFGEWNMRMRKSRWRWAPSSLQFVTNGASRQEPRRLNRHGATQQLAKANAADLWSDKVSLTSDFDSTSYW